MVHMGGTKKCVDSFGPKNWKGKDHWGDLDVDERIDNEMDLGEIIYESVAQDCPISGFCE